MLQLVNILHFKKLPSSRLWIHVTSGVIGLIVYFTNSGIISNVCILSLNKALTINECYNI